MPDAIDKAIQDALGTGGDESTTPITKVFPDGSLRQWNGTEWFVLQEKPSPGENWVWVDTDAGPARVPKADADYYNQKAREAKEKADKADKADAEAGKIPPLVTGTDGNQYRYNKATGRYEPAPGLPTKQETDPSQSASVIAARISAATQATRLKWDQDRAAILDDFEKEKINQEQARIELDKAYKTRQNELEAERNQIASRQNDISLRGQEVTQRGQNMDYASNMADTGVKAAMDSMQYIAPKGALDNFNKAIAGLGSGGYAPIEYGPQPTGEFPFDPTQLGMQIAAQALAGISPTAAQMIGAPVGVQNGFTPPQPAQPGPALPQFTRTPMPPSVGGSTG